MLKLSVSALLRNAIMVLSLSLLAACAASHAEQAKFSPSNPPLEAASQFREAYTEQIVQGTARNISNAELEDVEAVVEFLSATNRVIDIKIEEMGTLAPNATKEFTAHHPTEYRGVDVTGYRLRFRTSGHDQTLPYKDLSGNQVAQDQSEGGVNYTYADPGGSNSLPPVTQGGQGSRAEAHGSH
jgi:hypothetical protein